MAQRSRDEMELPALTNAARMRAGYGPATPRSILLARENYRPRASRTRRTVVAEPDPSPTAPDTVNGVLRIDQVGGGTLGYIRRTANSYGEYALGGQGAAVVATIPNPLLHPSNFDMRAPTDNAPIWQYFGAFLSPWAPPSSNFGSTANAHAILGPTNQASPGPATVHPGGTAFQYFYGASVGFPEQKMETAIWTIDPTTKKFSVNWINDAPDKQSTPARILWSPTQNNFVITSRVTTADWNAAFNIDYIDVQMTFVPNP
ncbi:hypothetical protein C8R43DRAFT_961046 [Mycena crocata]|nr:hypothetical protein C8R43DRAFT_961046 [Mycena crocata]